MSLTKDLDTASFRFNSRGTGNNWFPCFLCGHKPAHKCQTDLAAYVDPDLTKISLGFQTDGKVIAQHPIMNFFHDLDILAHLDYREYEPRHLQVKLGACGEHVPNLELLHYLTSPRNHITKHAVDLVIPGRKIP